MGVSERCGLRVAAQAADASMSGIGHGLNSSGADMRSNFGSASLVTQ
jgi:hypothetical protein